MLEVYGEDGLLLLCPVGQNTWGSRGWVELLERRSILSTGGLEGFGVRAKGAWPGSTSSTWVWATWYCSLNSSKGGYTGGYIGEYYSGYYGGY